MLVEVTMSDKILHATPAASCIVDIVEDHSNFSSVMLDESSHLYNHYCSPCNMHFNDARTLDYHISEIHKDEKTHKQQTNKTYSCSICNLTFKRQDHLKRHIRSLHTEKKYSKCPVCDKEFSEKDVLSQHIKRVHTGKNETYRCRECDYQCDSLKVLLIHELDHMDRHNCPHCTMSYKRRDHMTRHVKSEHMKMVVSCPMCEQIYKRKDHLVRHIKEKHKSSSLRAYSTQVVFKENV